MTKVPSAWSRERASVAAYFAVLGLVCATWGSSIDDMKLLLGLDEAEQGWLLFSGPVGNLVSFTFVSGLVTRIGSRRGVVVSAGAYLVAALGVAACFLTRAPLPFWCAAIAAMGMTGNMFNISVNAQGGIVERKAGRTIMNSFHAMFSVMGLVAASLAIGASSLGIPPGWRLVGVLAVGLAAHLAFFPGLPKDDDAVRKAKGEGLRMPDTRLLLIGLAALVIMGCEGSIMDWVGVFYRDSLAAPPGRAKWGFCAVCAMMTLGRFATDALINRVGAAIMLRLHSALVERLEKPRRKIEGTKFSIAQMETLHFPLVRTRAAAGLVSNFKAKVGTCPFR